MYTFFKMYHYTKNTLLVNSFLQYLITFLLQFFNNKINNLHMYLTLWNTLSASYNRTGPQDHRYSEDTLDRKIQCSELIKLTKTK